MAMTPRLRRISDFRLPTRSRLRLLKTGAPATTAPPVPRMAVEECGGSFQFDAFTKTRRVTEA